MSKTQNKFSPEVQSRAVRMALEYQSDSPSRWAAVSLIPLFDGDTRLIHRSDCGSQYVSIAYTQRLLDAGIEPSVGSVGDSYDNALAETISCLYKAEVIHRRRSWRAFEAVELATLQWVHWFNTKRLFEPIENIPPEEAERRYYNKLDQRPIAA